MSQRNEGRRNTYHQDERVDAISAFSTKTLIDKYFNFALKRILFSMLNNIVTMTNSKPFKLHLWFFAVLVTTTTTMGNNNNRHFKMCINETIARQSRQLGRLILKYETADSNHSPLARLLIYRPPPRLPSCHAESMLNHRIWSDKNN